MFFKGIIFISIVFLVCSQETCKITPPAPGPPGPPPGPPGGFTPEVPYNFSEVYQVIELDPSTGAKCLDGSNYKFYFTKGSGSGANKFMFSWQGGAFCGIDGFDTLESCFMRSQSPLGSSLSWGENGSFVSFNMSTGYFSSMEEYNPDFWNWNKILINYCDGSNHQGSVEQPIQFNGMDLWFRGYNNTISVFEYVREHFGLFEASEVIVSGGSAGGQATYIWSAYLPEYFPPHVKLMGMPDAGMFLDVYNTETECNLFRYLNHKISNLTNTAHLELFKNCKYFGTDDAWKCMVAEYILDDIRIPMFLINSQDDFEAMRTQFGVTCVTQFENCTETDFERVAQFREKFLGIVLRQKEKNPHWGFWLRTCFEHVYQGSMGWYGQTKNVFNKELGTVESLRDAVHLWYNNGHIKLDTFAHFIDVLNWKENPNCQYGKNQTETVLTFLQMK